MKKILMGLIISLISNFAMAQEDAISRFFEKYTENEEFTQVYITKRMFTLIADITDSEEDQELKAALNKLEGISILASDSTDGIKLYQEAISTIPIKEYEELMIVKKGKGGVKFLIKEEEKTIKELLMLVGGEDDFLIMSFVGEIDLNQIAKISKKMDVEGMQHLENLDKEE
ncbi:MAG: DUF4252 domain-containing protein [Flammeovirgaceae bacterium]|nr:DUF4252 domain-containing protein [Flammeovirgaceae bacterium]